MGVISVIFHDVSVILGFISQLSGVISSSPNPRVSPQGQAHVEESGACWSPRTGKTLQGIWPIYIYIYNSYI